MKLIPQH